MKISNLILNLLESAVVDNIEDEKARLRELHDKHVARADSSNYNHDDTNLARILHTKSRARLAHLRSIADRRLDDISHDLGIRSRSYIAADLGSDHPLKHKVVKYPNNFIPTDTNLRSGEKTSLSELEKAGLLLTRLKTARNIMGHIPDSPEALSVNRELMAEKARRRHEKNFAKHESRVENNTSTNNTSNNISANSSNNQSHLSRHWGKYAAGAGVIGAGIIGRHMYNSRSRRRRNMALGAGGAALAGLGVAALLKKLRKKK